MRVYIDYNFTGWRRDGGDIVIGPAFATAVGNISIGPQYQKSAAMNSLPILTGMSREEAIEVINAVLIGTTSRIEERENENDIERNGGVWVVGGVRNGMTDEDTQCETIYILANIMNLFKLYKEDFNITDRAMRHLFEYLKANPDRWAQAGVSTTLHNEFKRRGWRFEGKELPSPDNPGV